VRVHAVSTQAESTGQSKPNRSTTAARHSGLVADALFMSARDVCFLPEGIITAYTLSHFSEYEAQQATSKSCTASCQLVFPIRVWALEGRDSACSQISSFDPLSHCFRGADAKEENPAPVRERLNCWKCKEHTAGPIKGHSTSILLQHTTKYYSCRCPHPSPPATPRLLSQSTKQPIRPLPLRPCPPHFSYASKQ